MIDAVGSASACHKAARITVFIADWIYSLEDDSSSWSWAAVKGAHTRATSWEIPCCATLPSAVASLAYQDRLPVQMVFFLLEEAINFKLVHAGSACCKKEASLVLFKVANQFTHP